MQEAVGMTASEVLRLSDMGLNERACLNEAVRGFLKISEGEIVRWIQLRSGVLLVVVAPGDESSAEIYVFDRRDGVFYLLQFDDRRFGGYTKRESDTILDSYRLFGLVERPWLLKRGSDREQQWLVQTNGPAYLF